MTAHRTPPAHGLPGPSAQGEVGPPAHGEPGPPAHGEPGPPGGGLPGLCAPGLPRPSGRGRSQASGGSRFRVRPHDRGRRRAHQPSGGHLEACAHAEGGTSRRAGRSGGRWRAEEGGATLVALGLAGFVMLAGMLVVDVGALVAARAAAQTAADMAALAALTPRGGAVEAAGIAAANGAELASCDCSAVQAVVAVRRRVPLVPTGLSVRVTARAKAVLGAPAPAEARPTGRREGAAREPRRHRGTPPSHRGTRAGSARAGRDG
jgi:hypothetical protein